MGQPPFILALDVGASSTRSLLFDATGTTVPGVGAQLSYKLTTSNDGEVSVDAGTLVDAVVKTIDEALKAAGQLSAHIGAVAIDTFWHSLVGVHAFNNAVTPYNHLGGHSPFACRRRIWSSQSSVFPPP